MQNDKQAFLKMKNILLSKDNLTKSDVPKVKRDCAREFGLSIFPRNSDILAVCSEDERQKLLPVLQKRTVRTLSGVAIVAVMTRPWACPHGKCIMCPGGPDVDRPQSYTGYEPTSRRGIRNDYDPYKQVTERIKQLKSIGHSTEKIDVIIMGGTFTYQPLDYQKWFIKRIFDALNGVDSKTIEQAHITNEGAKHRCVGLTAETRPDQVNIAVINTLLNYGVTRLELGIQTVFDDIFEKISRGHTSKDSIKAIKLTKDSGLKFTAHMMPGLPGSSFERDIESFRILFNSSDYQPDEIKIYPTMVIPGTKLYQDWKDGKYKALTNVDTIQLVAKIKELIPPYVRVKRILRDIPSHQIEAGPNKSDLRLDAQKLLKAQGKSCSCIRCREVGLYIYKNKGPFNPKSIEFIHRKYEASGGIEHFLSYEETENDVIIGFLRLREISDAVIRPEFTDTITAIIRELHVYGESLGVNLKGVEAYQWQHKGYGKLLLRKAEEIVGSQGVKKLAIISGVGVREYYKKLGYSQDGPYVSKLICD